MFESNKNAQNEYEFCCCFFLKTIYVNLLIRGFLFWILFHLLVKRGSMNRRIFQCVVQYFGSLHTNLCKIRSRFRSIKCNCIGWCILWLMWSFRLCECEHICLKYDIRLDQTYYTHWQLIQTCEWIAEILINRTWCGLYFMVLCGFHIL